VVLSECSSAIGGLGQGDSMNEDAETGVQTGTDTPAGPIKNVILMIADGAGFNTLEATRLYIQGLPPGDARAGVGPLVVDGQGFVYTWQSV